MPEKVVQRCHRFAGMPTPAQLESALLTHLAAKAGPPGLIGRIGLLNSEPLQRLLPGQRAAGAPRRQRSPWTGI